MLKASDLIMIIVVLAVHGIRGLNCCRLVAVAGTHRQALHSLAGRAEGSRGREAREGEAKILKGRSRSSARQDGGGARGGGGFR